MTQEHVATRPFGESCICQDEAQDVLHPDCRVFSV